MSDSSNPEPSETTRLMSDLGQPRNPRDYIDMDGETNREENGEVQVGFIGQDKQKLWA